MLKKRDIWRPGKRSTGTRDQQAEKRDVPAKTGRVATLFIALIELLVFMHYALFLLCLTPFAYISVN